MEKAVAERSEWTGVGADIRALRRAQELTLAELALKVGRSVGWLSQLERGQSEPSLSDLKKLGEVLGVKISFFFQNAEAPEGERGYVVRSNSRRSLGDDQEGWREELLSPDLGGEFEMIRCVFEAGAERTEWVERDTEEMAYLVSGELEISVGDRHFTVQAGDSFRIRREPFRWRNSGNDDAVAIWTISPPVY